MEHILSRNAESKALFITDGLLDEPRFEAQRNCLGALLLLKGQDNQAAGAEPYSQKLRTYTGNAPYLAQTLVRDFYKANTAMKNFREASGLNFVPEPVFNLDTLERRSTLMYEIATEIWFQSQAI